MAMNTIAALFSILAIWAFSNVDSATPNHAPAPAVDCSTLVLNMVDCLSYVTNGSTVTKPQGSCCSGLKTVLKANAECLCETFKNSAQLGVTLNVTKAMGLPAACHVSAPSVSNCGLSPGGAPALLPMATPPSAAVPTAGGAGGNVLAPAPASGSSGSSALAISVRSLLLTLVAASFSWF